MREQLPWFCACVLGSPSHSVTLALLAALATTPDSLGSAEGPGTGVFDFFLICTERLPACQALFKNMTCVNSFNPYSNLYEVGTIIIPVLMRKLEVQRS